MHDERLDDETLDQLVEISKRSTETGRQVEHITKGILEAGLDELARRHREQNPRLSNHQAYVAALKSPAGKAIFDAHVLAPQDKE